MFVSDAHNRSQPDPSQGSEKGRTIQLQPMIKSRRLFYIFPQCKITLILIFKLNCFYSRTSTQIM